MKLKNEYQNYFKRKCFTHHITLPPSPITEKNVVSCLNEIVFKLNKTFLKSSFPKYDMTDTFRFFIFPEDKNINKQHFHILLFSPRKKEKEFNKDNCIACKFKEDFFFETCKYCTARVLNQLISDELPTLKNVEITINDENDYYSNIYATKKQNFEYEYADSYLVCT